MGHKCHSRLDRESPPVSLCEALRAGISIIIDSMSPRRISLRSSFAGRSKHGMIKIRRFMS